MSETQPLHLPDLYIEGFRGIDKLSIPRLGRATLLAGRNGAGQAFGQPCHATSAKSRTASRRSSFCWRVPSTRA